MQNYNEQLKLAEYSSLRNEIQQGKQYIFERPLAIVLAAGIAAASLTSDARAALPAPLVGLLLFNFWFTVNRLQSMGRIIAYVAAVLEPHAERPWIGWEGALRYYRIWLYREKESCMRRFVRMIRELAHPGRSSKEGESAVQVDERAVPDALMFYPHLLVFHAAAIGLALVGSGLLLLESRDPIRLIGLGVTAGMSLVFPFMVLKFYRPCEMKRNIEEQRAVWLSVPFHWPIEKKDE